MSKIIKRVIIILTALMLLIPIPRRLKDGGTVEYNAVLYSVDKVHQLCRYGIYAKGTRVRILFWTVYDDVEERDYWADEPETERKEEENNSRAFSEATMEKIGEHTYFEKDMFEVKNISAAREEYTKECLEKADHTLEEDVCLEGVYESETRGELRLLAKKYTDGIVYDDFEYGAAYQEGIGYEWGRCDYTIKQAEPDKSGLMPVEDIIEIVYDTASGNLEKMSSDFNKVTEIKGTYILTTNIDGELIYVFTINKNSTVSVDAHTGEILTEHFWDGIYY